MKRDYSTFEHDLREVLVSLQWATSGNNDFVKQAGLTTLVWLINHNYLHVENLAKEYRQEIRGLIEHLVEVLSPDEDLSKEIDEALKVLET